MNFPGWVGDPRKGVYSVHADGLPLDTAKADRMWGPRDHDPGSPFHNTVYRDSASHQYYHVVRYRDGSAPYTGLMSESSAVAFLSHNKYEVPTDLKRAEKVWRDSAEVLRPGALEVNPLSMSRGARKEHDH